MLQLDETEQGALGVVLDAFIKEPTEQEMDQMVERLSLLYGTNDEDLIHDLLTRTIKGVRARLN